MEAEMADNTQAIEKYYIEYFSRPADYTGFQFWNNIFNTQPDAVPQISAAFAASQEYRDTYAGLDNTAVVQAIYHNLFGRDGEAAGVNFWVNALNNHAATIDDIVDKIADGAQGNDKVVVNGRVSVASTFTQHLDTAAEQAAYSGAAANATAKAFIGTIVDLASGAAASDPGVIDATIAEIVGAHTNAVAGHFIG
jgi:hypothetical protein